MQEEEGNMNVLMGLSLMVLAVFMSHCFQGRLDNQVHGVKASSAGGDIGGIVLIIRWFTLYIKCYFWVKKG